MSIVPCSVEECDRGGRLVRGMCGMHYQRVTKVEKPCAVDGCTNGNANGSTGYCMTHHRRLEKHGDPLVTMKGKAHKVQYTADGLRICKVCGEAKALTEYHKDTGGTDGYRAQCKPCRNGYMASYYEDNRASRVAYEQMRRTERSGHMRALDMARYERHRDKRIALASDHVRIRRARLAGAEMENGVTVRALRELNGDLCCYCGIVMDFARGVRGDGIPSNRASLEHVVPISRGGGHTFANTALACHLCNVSKNAKLVSEWIGPEVMHGVPS